MWTFFGVQNPSFEIWARNKFKTKIGGFDFKDRKQGDNNYPDEIGPNSRNGTGMGFYS